MAQILIPLKDDEMQAQVEAAFAASFANPDSLDAEGLVVKHVSNFIRGILNEHLEKQAVEAAKAGVAKVEDLAS